MSGAAPGRPVWLELNAQRVSLASRFYAELFAWERRPLHVAPWGSIPLISNGARVFANEFMAMGAFATPLWHVRLSGDPEAARPAIEAAGGRADPLQAIPGHATSVFARDPAGTSFTVIRLDDAPPEEDAPGDPCLAEYWGPEARALAPFYASVFGLRAEETEAGATLRDGDTPRLALRQTDFEILPPRWIPYVATLSLGGDVEHARRLGAVVQVHPEERPGLGRIAVLSDPAGVAFGLLER